MGPFSEQKQLERLHRVGELLQRNDLTEWARNYWSGVYNSIAMTEERYNARVVATWQEIRTRQTRNWIR